jgi:hypothetical protein
MATNYEAIYSSPGFIAVIDSLLLNLFSKNIDNKQYAEINKAELRKCIWMASILAGSDMVKHKQRVQQLSSLLYLTYLDEPSIGKICYILYSRIGNLTATRFLRPLFANQSKKSFRTSLHI